MFFEEVYEAAIGVKGVFVKGVFDVLLRDDNVFDEVFVAVIGFEVVFVKEVFVAELKMNILNMKMFLLKKSLKFYSGMKMCLIRKCL